jgi:hypothetical protein
MSRMNVTIDGGDEGELGPRWHHAATDSGGSAHAAPARPRARAGLRAHDEWADGLRQKTGSRNRVRGALKSPFLLNALLAIYYLNSILFVPIADFHFCL